MPDVEIFCRWEDLIAYLYFLKTGPPKTISFYLEETDPVCPCNYAVDELNTRTKGGEGQEGTTGETAEHPLGGSMWLWCSLCYTDWSLSQPHSVLCQDAAAGVLLEVS